MMIFFENVNLLDLLFDFRDLSALGIQFMLLCKVVLRKLFIKSFAKVPLEDQSMRLFDLIEMLHKFHSNVFNLAIFIFHFRVHFWVLFAILFMSSSINDILMIVFLSLVVTVVTLMRLNLRTVIKYFVIIIHNLVIEK